MADRPTLAAAIEALGPEPAQEDIERALREYGEGPVVEQMKLYTELVGKNQREGGTG